MGYPLRSRDCENHQYFQWDTKKSRKRPNLVPQNRGHRSHWMRPSSSVATQRSIREGGRASVSKIINELVLANKDKLEAELK